MKGENRKKDTQINRRINQIREELFDGDNRLFSSQIGEKEQNLSSICSGNRTAALTVIIRILQNLQNIDANWLIVGRGDMTIQKSLPRASYEEELNLLKQNNSILVDHIECLKKEISKQKEELKLEREKTKSNLEQTNLEPISQ